jgi:hypothetical protein
MRNSAMASTGGSITKPPSTLLKLSAPSMRKVVGFGTLAVYGVGLAVAQRATSLGKASGKGNHAGLQNAKLREMAAVQREVLDGALVNSLAKRGGAAFNEQCIGIDFDLARTTSDCKMDGDKSSLIDFQDETFAHEALKTLASACTR